MSNHVFREYDIRGVVQNDFHQDFVEKLGKSFGTFLKSQNHNKVSVSGDVRESTILLKHYFIHGLLSCGLDVYDLGVLPTPVNYFSLFNTDIVNSYYPVITNLHWKFLYIPILLNCFATLHL